MAAQALYLKYRPRTFDEVVGQDAITRTLRNALREERLRHAYLFTGPRGTGKTTTARLLAKAVNCLAPVDERPCNHCDICKAINDGRLLDLIEIDAASNRGIDEMRDIRDKVGFKPSQARYKVYVLDEAHMLTDPAFNALLKTLEEPPPHVIFCLVTTDPHKIPATIASRCQRFDFKRLSVQTLIDRLALIAAREGLHVEPAALEMIARQSTGAMRDAISLLDQLTSYGSEIALDQVQMVLGAGTGEAAARLVRAIVAGDVAGGLALINQGVADGIDTRQLGREIVEYLRGVLLIKQGAGARLLNATAEQAAEMEAAAAQLSTARLLDAIRLFNGAAMDLKGGLQTIPQLPLELALVQCMAGSPEPAGGLPAEPPALPARPAPYGERPAPAAEPVARPGAEPAGRPAEPPARTAAEPVGKYGAEAAGKPGAEPEAAAAQAGGDLTLAQVQAAWPEMLAAVKQRNGASQAVLKTGCKPVEVTGNEIVITFPYGWIRQKLDDPLRRRELQEAFDQVLGAPCRFRLVLESDYRPGPGPGRRGGPPSARPPAPPSGRSGAEPPGKPGPQTADKPEAASGGTPAEETSGKPAEETPGSGDDTVDTLARWAKERGGQISVV